MGKFVRLLSAVLLLGCLLITVNATATTSSYHAGVASDGSCQVNLSVTVHLDEVAEKLYFPLPQEATGVRLNGSRVGTSRSGQVRNVRVAKNVVGDFSFNIQYTLRDVIEPMETGDRQQLVLPLLSGFAYSVKSLDFTVVMPGTVEDKPSFVSGYHKAGVEEYLDFSTDGMTVTGSALKQLNDHETLTMYLPVSSELFPLSVVQKQSPATFAVIMAICGALALLYYLIFLRYFPRIFGKQLTPPEGVDAGSYGCVLAMEGVDLSMRVLTWAQLGYLTIHRERGKRVILYKRMEMGNERSEAERRCYQKLFAKGSMVDTGSLAYAKLSRMMAAQPSGIQALIHPRSGSTKIFRLIASLMGVMGGAGLGLVLGRGAVLQVFLILLLGVLGGLSAWQIQKWASGLFLRRKKNLVLGLVLSTLWLIAFALSGQFAFGAGMVASLLAAGILLRWGGRRTEQGRQSAGEITSLHRSLLRPDGKQLRALSQEDPEYFFRILPYAMALGADRVFAKVFGKQRLGECPYITGTSGSAMTAMQWCQLIRDTVSVMENRANRLASEQVLGLIQSVLRK